MPSKKRKATQTKEPNQVKKLRGFPLPCVVVEPTIIYVDEAGRGAGAGPLHVAAVIVKTLPVQPSNILIADSKLLTVSRRDRSYDWIQSEKSIRTALSIIPSTDIDELGLQESWRKGVRECVRLLVPDEKERAECKVVIDGNVCRSDFDDNEVLEVVGVPKADRIHYACACAGITAKVSRDRAMSELVGTLSEENQELFGSIFKNQHGYLNPAHMVLMRKGVFIEGIHRKSFNPLKTAMLTKT
jgi:ribonuclease HII